MKDDATSAWLHLRRGGTEQADRLGMLTDIFSNRYAGVTLWETFEEKDRRFLVQAFRTVSEQLYPYWKVAGDENPSTNARWQVIHDKLSMELGLEALSAKAYSYPTTLFGKTSTQVGLYNVMDVCKNFVLAAYDGSLPADRFMKERLSFIEIAFRERAEELEATAPRRLAQAREQLLRKEKGGIRVPGNPVTGMQALINRWNQEFRNAVDELNARMRQAGYELHYHNGFIQRSVDPVLGDQIEGPFWDLVSDATWKNVDVDMKEAIDRRDNGDRDPAFCAARALESTIKIISDKKGWTHGGEKGAHNYIDNLGSKKAGPFIESWEKDMLKDFFSHVRNPLGHGPGNERMPALSPEQTNWAIETCMCWIKSLIRRM